MGLKRMAELISILNEANDLYRDGEESTMSDAQYEALMEELAELDPTKPLLRKVCTDKKVKGQVLHKFDVPMISMDKVKTYEELMTKWVKRLPNYKSLSFAVTLKIDGVSIDNSFTNRSTKSLAKKGVYTRRGGDTGLEVKNWEKYKAFDVALKWSPSLKTNSDISIRGEAYLSKYLLKLGWDKLRNKCAGILNRDNFVESENDNIEFVAYNLVGFTTEQFKKMGITKYTDKLDLLARSGCPTVTYKVVDYKGLKGIIDYYNDTWREIAPYETDGIIITVNDLEQQDLINKDRIVDHHNHYDIAVKPPPKAKIGVLDSITIEVSRHGKLCPVGVLKEPVVIDGISISNFTLHNMKHILVNKLAGVYMGKIERANDVIPYFAGIVKKSGNVPWVPPKKCPFCKGKLEWTKTLSGKQSVDIRCTNKYCPPTRIDMLINYFTTLSIPEIRVSYARVIVEDLGYNKLSDILLKYKDIANRLETMDGFGPSRVQTWLSNIEKHIMYPVDFITLMSGLGIKGVRESYLEKIGIRGPEDIYKYRDAFETSLRYEVEKNIRVWIMDDENYEELQKLEGILTVIKHGDVIPKGVSVKVAITGTAPSGLSRVEIANVLKQHGFILGDFNKETQYLILGIDKSTGKLKASSKRLRAETQGTQIVKSYKDLLK